MGYQYIENHKNSREVTIREYEDTDAASLPDERYQLKLRYLDNAQLIEERKAYDLQLKSFDTEILHVWDLVQVVSVDSKPFAGITDFDDLAKKCRNKIKTTIKDKTREPLYEDIVKVWDEVSFVKPPETQVEISNRTYLFEKDKIHRRITLIGEKLAAIYGHLYPIERRVIEDRIGFLEWEFNRFDYMINPFHLLPGLVLDMDITSVKRKKATLNGMMNVLSEFLDAVSKGSKSSFAWNSRSGQSR
jgi:ABC-type transporter Mla MlaB component